MYKIHFNLRSFDLNSLLQTETYLFFLLTFFDFGLLKQKTMPKKVKKITVLRSPHIDKKSREQFKMVSHKKTLVLVVANENLFFLLLKIIKDIQFIGVEVEIVIEFCTF